MSYYETLSHWASHALKAGWAWRVARLGLIVLTVVAPAQGGVAGPTEEPVLTRSTWSGKLAEGATLRVVNPFGNIRVRFGGWEGQAEVLATVQSLTDTAPAHELAVEESAEVVSVAVGYPAGTMAAAAGGQGTATGRVDLVVFLPAGRPLEARTGAGLLECRGLRSDLSLTSASGDVNVKATLGAVDVRTGEGRISLVLEADASRAAQVLESESGEITVYIPENADLRVQAATSGEICTEYSLDVEHRAGTEPGKLATAVIGKAASELVMQSRRGRIRLLQRPMAGTTPDEAPAGAGQAIERKGHDQEDDIAG